MTQGRRDGAAELWLGHYSLRHAGLGERWPAAAAAGFTGISAAYGEILALRDDGISASALRKQADSLGLRLTELEYFCLASAGSPNVVQALAADMAGTAAELGCASVTAVGKSPEGFVEPAPAGEPVSADVVRNLRILADACAQAGLGCTFEFMPFVTAVDTLDRARQLLLAADRGNVGLTIDALHFFRAGADWEGLHELSPGDVCTVQLCDGPVTGPPDSYITESLEFRSCPGEGPFDLTRFVSALRRFSGPFTVEVLSGELAALPPEDAARRMHDSTRKVLAAVVGG